MQYTSFTQEIEKFSFDIFEIIQDFWSGYITVNPVPNYGIFYITQKNEANEANRETISKLNITYMQDTDYVKYGDINISRTPTDFTAYFPLGESISEVNGSYNPSLAGTAQFEELEESVRVGDSMFLADSSSLDFDDILLTDDFTISFWMNHLNVVEWVDILNCIDARQALNKIKLKMDGSNYVSFENKYANFSAGWSDLVFFAFRREDGIISLSVNSYEESEGVVVGDVSTVLAVSGILHDLSNFCDLNIFARSLTDDEIVSLMYYPKAVNIQSFDITYFQCSSSIFNVSNRYEYYMNGRVGSDDNCIISTFEMVAETEMDYVVYDRELSCGKHIVAGCTDFYEFKDHILASESSDLFESKTDDYYNFDRNTIKYNKDIYGTGIWRARGSIDRFMLLSDRPMSTFSYWFKLDYEHIKDYHDSASLELISAERQYTYAQLLFFKDKNGDGLTIDWLNYGQSPIFNFSTAEAILWCARPHHFVIVTERQNYFKLYVDGVFYRLYNARDQIVEGGSLLDRKFSIGMAGYNPFFRGSISHLRLYDRALTSFSVSVLANDPHFVMGQRIEPFSFHRFEVRQNFEQIVGLLNNVRVNDILNDRSCICNWSCARDPQSRTLFDSRRKAITGWQWQINPGHRTDEISTYSDGEKDGIFTVHTPSYADISSVFNQNVVSHKSTITCDMKIIRSGSDIKQMGVTRANSAGGLGNLNKNAPHILVSGNNLKYVLTADAYEVLYEWVLNDADILYENWNNIALVTQRLGASNKHKITLFVNGMTQGEQYGDDAYYKVYDGGSLLECNPVTESYGTGEGFGLGIYPLGTVEDYLGSVRLFNKDLNSIELLKIANDCNNHLNRLDVVSTIEAYSVFHDETFLRHHIDPDYWQDVLTDEIDPFGDESGEYLWKYDGNYLEYNNRSSVTQYSGDDFLWTTDAKFGEAWETPYGNKGATFTIDDPVGGDCSFSFHFKSKGATFSSETNHLWLRGLSFEYNTSIESIRTYSYPNEEFYACPLEDMTDAFNHIVVNFYDDSDDEDILHNDIYLNGVLIIETWGFSFSSGRGAIEDIAYGNDGGAHSWDPFYGMIDQARIFNRVLNEDEIAILSTESIAPKSFLFRHTIEPLAFCNSEITQEMERYSFNRFDIVHSFSNVSEFHRCNFVHEVETKNITTMIKRITL